MFRTFVPGLAVIGLAVPPAHAEIPPPPPATVAMIAGSCRPGQAFGFKLGEVHEESRFASVKAEHRPFRTLTVRTSPRSHRIIGVDLDAWDEEDAGTLEEKTAAAVRLVEAVDTAVAAQGRFSERSYDEENDTISWTTPDPEGGEGGVRFDIGRLGVGVYLTCQDLAMEALAMDEMFGRVRVERPTRPNLGLPPRTDLADCADPAKADALLTAHEERGGDGMLDAVKSSQEYFEHLADWYGQQLMDAGVWDEDRKSAFLMGMLEDETLMRGFEQQVERLGPMMEGVMSYAELRQ